MSAGDARPDWTVEGLLDGLASDDERAGRRELLDRLHEEGCTLDELRKAVREDRIALLPIERMLLSDRRFTMADAIELSGMSADYLRADRRAIGLPEPQEDELLYNEASLRSFQGLRLMLDAGVTEEQLLSLTRLVGDASAKLADAAVRTLALALLQPGASERDLGLGMVDIANGLMPHVSNMLRGPLELHLAEIIRQEAVGRFERERGEIPGGRPVAVCFADMVGFTRLSEQLSIDELGAVTQRFGDLAGEVASAPVRLVKTIGDEAMLASEDAAALVETSLELIAAAERDDLLPSLRAGAAAGQALRRAGDWYGRPVNLAARITTVAPPGGLIAEGGLRDAAGDGFAWQDAGRQGFKGIDGQVELYRAERSTA